MALLIYLEFKVKNKMSTNLFYIKQACTGGQDRTLFGNVQYTLLRKDMNYVKYLLFR